MLPLASGVLLFAFVHFFKSLAPGARAALIGRIGVLPYRGLHSVLILAAIAGMIEGYREAPVILVFDPPWWGGFATFPVMIAAFVLFVASQMPTNIRRVMRHPMLSAVILWALAHLTANGNAADLVLFGGMGIWAGAEILLINRREGPWARPEPVSIARDVLAVAAGFIVFCGTALLHLMILEVRLF